MYYDVDDGIGIYNNAWEANDFNVIIVEECHPDGQFWPDSIEDTRFMNYDAWYVVFFQCTLIHLKPIPIVEFGPTFFLTLSLVLLSDSTINTLLNTILNFNDAG